MPFLFTTTSSNMIHDLVLALAWGGCEIITAREGGGDRCSPGRPAASESMKGSRA